MTRRTQILNLTPYYFSQVKSFCDEWIGTNYYSDQDIKKCWERSLISDLNSSFIACDQKGNIIAIRLTYAPGNWIEKETKGLTPDLWPCPQSHMAYFKSLFVHADYQQQGLGKELSSQSLLILKKMGAQAVLCHSWLESPGNSSQKYLEQMNFKKIKNHPLFWNPIDYDCPRCFPDRCQCTAVEMAKNLREDQ